MPIMNRDVTHYRHYYWAALCVAFAALQIPLFLHSLDTVSPWLLSMCCLAAGFMYFPGQIKSAHPLSIVLLLNIFDIFLQGKAVNSLQVTLTLIVTAVHTSFIISTAFLVAWLVAAIASIVALTTTQYLATNDALAAIGVLLSSLFARYIFDRWYENDLALRTLQGLAKSKDDQLSVTLRSSNVLLLDIDWQRNEVFSSKGLLLFLGKSIQTPDSAFSWWKASLEASDLENFESAVSRSALSKEPVSTLVRVNLTGVKQNFKLTVLTFPDPTSKSVVRLILTLQDQQLEIASQARYQRNQGILKAIREACEIRYVWGSLRRDDKTWIQLEGACIEMFGVECKSWVGQEAFVNDGWEKLSENEESRMQFAVTAGQSIMLTHRYALPRTNNVITLACCLWADITNSDVMECVLIDISALQNRDKRLRQLNDSLKIAETSTADFLSLINHELMTPMNSLAGYVQVAFASSKDDMVRNHLAAALNSVKRLKIMLNDTVSLGEIHLIHLRPEHKPFSLGQLIFSLQRSVDVRIEGRQVVFNLQLDTRLPDAVVGDVVKIRQILTRVLNYATTFTKRGKVSFMISLGKVDFQSGLIEVVFEIKDSTRGIAQESLRRLTQSGSKDKPTHLENLKHDQSMTLVLASQHTQYLNGQFKVDSISGVGNMFNLTFPLEAVRSLEVKKAAEVLQAFQNDSKDDPDVGEQQNRLEGKHVLIVDDNPLNNESLKLLLELDGALVNDVLLPSKALTELSLTKTPFDAIILDIQMPEMDGFELANKIRQLPSYTHVPIIFISANFDNNLKEKSLASGGNLLLTKPFNRDHLVIPLSQLMAGHPITFTPNEALELPLTNVDDGGLDIERALDNLGGNTTIFHNMVKRFLVRIQADAEEFEQFLLSGDVKLSAEKAHFIAGGAAIIGASSLANWLKEFEKRTLDDPSLVTLDQDLKTFKRLHESTYKAAQHVLEKA